MLFSDCLTTEQENDRLADLTYEALYLALEKTMRNDQNRNGIHFVGEELLCRTETQAKGIADFFEDLGFNNVTTGYYDPEKDKKKGTVDEYTGWYYIDWE